MFSSNKSYSKNQLKSCFYSFRIILAYKHDISIVWYRGLAAVSSCKERPPLAGGGTSTAQMGLRTGRRVLRLVCCLPTRPPVTRAACVPSLAWRVGGRGRRAGVGTLCQPKQLNHPPHPPQPPLKPPVHSGRPANKETAAGAADAWPGVIL